MTDTTAPAAATLDLATAGPSQIDTVWADLYAQEGAAETAVAKAVDRLHYDLDQRPRYVGRAGRREWPVNDADTIDQARARAAAGERTSLMNGNRPFADEVARYDAALAQLAVVEAAQRPLSAEWDRRGGWSRFFEVDANNGHIHRSMGCQTCNRGHSRTRFGWHPELSGLTEADAVKKLGARLCTVCFPSAPVEWTNGHTSAAATKCAGRAKDGSVRRQGMRTYGDCAACGATGQLLTQSGALRKHTPVPVELAGDVEPVAQVDAPADVAPAPADDREIRIGDRVRGRCTTVGSEHVGTVVEIVPPERYSGGTESVYHLADTGESFRDGRPLTTIVESAEKIAAAPGRIVLGPEWDAVPVPALPDDLRPVAWAAEALAADESHIVPAGSWGLIVQTPAGIPLAVSAYDRAPHATAVGIEMSAVERGRRVYLVRRHQYGTTVFDVRGKVLGTLPNGDVHQDCAPAVREGSAARIEWEHIVRSTIGVPAADEMHDENITAAYRRALALGEDVTDAELVTAVREFEREHGEAAFTTWIAAYVHQVGDPIRA